MNPPEKARKKLRLTKARKRLETRRRSYEETCKHRQDNGIGFRRPGSLKVSR